TIKALIYETDRGAWVRGRRLYPLGITVLAFLRRGRMCGRSRPCQGEPSRGAPCNNIGRVTVTLTTSESAPGTAEADVLVIGVIQTPDGPSAAPGAEGVDEALGGTLSSTLTALGASGDLEELTKIPGGGKLPAAVVLAVGLGAPPESGPFGTDELTRAAG